jgi:HEAT repeat protein
MNKPSFKKLLWIFVLLAVASSLAAFFYFAAAPRKESAANATGYAAAPKTLPPEMMMRMESALIGNGVAKPTPEQEKEAAQIDQEQVKAATAWLSDADPERRVAGAEQLAAYPTPEAEKRLAESLAHDQAPEVRAEAARSLDAFIKPEAKTVQALLSALEDPDENVRQTALGVLQSLRQRLEDDGKNKAAGKVLAGLKKRSKSSRVPNETRKEIADYLRDLQ